MCNYLERIAFNRIWQKIVFCFCFMRVTWTSRLTALFHIPNVHSLGQSKQLFLKHVWVCNQQHTSHSLVRVPHKQDKPMSGRYHISSQKIIFEGRFGHSCGQNLWSDLLDILLRPQQIYYYNSLCKSSLAAFLSVPKKLLVLILSLLPFPRCLVNK